MTIITLTTDFGVDDSYVAVMKGVILTITPHAQIVDITHQIEPQNVRRTAEALVGAFDEIIFHLLTATQTEREGQQAVGDMVQFGLRATGYLYT